MFISYLWRFLLIDVDVYVVYNQTSVEELEKDIWVTEPAATCTWVRYIEDHGCVEPCVSQHTDSNRKTRDHLQPVVLHLLLLFLPAVSVKNMSVEMRGNLNLLRFFARNKILAFVFLF